MQDQLLTRTKRLVVKIGSSLVTSRGEGLRLNHISSLTKDLTAVQAANREVVVVSSGAIVSGIDQLELKSYPHALPLKQAAAAVGQSRLMRAYEKSFEELGFKVAQILLTHQDLADRKRFLNARHTLTSLIRFGVIPIINENDTVSVDEIQFGDNDTLAAQVAHVIDADLLVILSDVDGFYTADPRLDPSATLIPVVEEITKDIEQRAGIIEDRGEYWRDDHQSSSSETGCSIRRVNLNHQRWKHLALLPRALNGGSGRHPLHAQPSSFTKPEAVDCVYLASQGSNFSWTTGPSMPCNTSGKKSPPLRNPRGERRVSTWRFRHLRTDQEG